MSTATPHSRRGAGHGPLSLGDVEASLKIFAIVVMIFLSWFEFASGLLEK